jgi:hypothetical protein
MKIIQVSKPAFLYRDEPYTVDSRMFESFTQFDEYIQKNKDKGATHCFMYSVMNVGIDDNIIHPDGNDAIDLLFIRCKFVNLEIKDEDYLGKNMTKIKKIVEDETN